mmetsp:Transcript_18778/g.46979  ORF Transcript_18778/g.46979 Transcript_18778/m.46979 type:complete len:203 (+) Transcript_18778:173-781(+)
MEPIASARRPMRSSSNLRRPPRSSVTSAAKAKLAERRRSCASWYASSLSPSVYAEEERIAVETVAPMPRVSDRPKLAPTWPSILATPPMNLEGASLSLLMRVSMIGSMCGWQRVRPCPMIWKERVMMFAPSTVIATGIDMYAFPTKLALPLQMPAPPTMSIPSVITRRPRSVHDCFMIEERTIGASWLSMMALVSSVPARMM